MNYKVEGAIRKNRKNFIIYAILWLIIAIVLVPTITNSYVMGVQPGSKGLTTAIEVFTQSITNPFSAIDNIIKMKAMGTYFSVLLISTIIFSVFFFIGFVKSAPKNEYSDIEHGSSDWSRNGEQYSILSKNKGLILAENNYLPLNKRGNVNVLVVGRIRFW